MIVAALVLIAVAVGVLFLVRDDDSGLDAEGAADGFAAVLDDAEFDETGYSDLRRCPFGDEADIAEAISAVVDVPDEVLEADALEFVFEGDDDVPESISCVLATDADVSGDVAAMYIYAHPRDRGDYADQLEESESTADVTVEDPYSHKGGEVYPYCVDDQEAESQGCGADWVDDDSEIALGLVLIGDDVETEDASEALKLVLPDLVDNLASEA